MLTLLLGGARSGKSRLAAKLAVPFERVCYLATAQPGDDGEMLARIRRHQAERPAHWHTTEESLDLGSAVAAIAPQYDAVLVDCLTVWLSNLLWHGREEPVECVESTARAQLAQIAVAARSSRVILVSNEVGSGIVPESALARTFRDLQGLVNQSAAEAADEVALVVAGLPLYLKQVR